MLRFLQKAIRLEPDYAAVHGLIAWCHERRYLRGGLLPETRQAALEHARMGIRLGPYDPLIYLPYVGLAFANLFTGNCVEAAGAASRASSANPRFSVPRYLRMTMLADALHQAGLPE